ncbi:Protein kinase C iota type [Fukomys damarensis]|uniref:Protein kinase C iota type n=1 Tax=Fukomys damarensis TaxID=885580 RepID=A0A091CPC1_FUKDA|nr:Protein kinase C iota type [Fukomys damarensis]
MLSCFSTPQGGSLRTPARESICERLRRRLTPSSRCRPHCSSHTTVTDTPGKVSPGVTTSALPKSRRPREVSLSPNTTGAEAGKSAGQVSPRPETPSHSGQVSPEPDTENLESPSPGAETEVTALGPQETPRSLVYIHPGLAAAIGNNFTESLVELRPVWSVQAVRPHSLAKRLPIFLDSQPVYGPFFPGTSTTHTSTRSALILRRDIMTSFENYSSSEGLRDKDRDVWCLNNKQLFTPDWIEEEGDPYTASPQLELEEATRLSKIKDYELLIPALPCEPEHPKVPCPGEEKSIRHRAAGRWRKLYCANGHPFQVKRFSRVGGLGRQVYTCTRCKLSVHKKCHQLVTVQCGQRSYHQSPWCQWIHQPWRQTLRRQRSHETVQLMRL